MSRLFNGSSDFITFAPGAAATMQTTAFTAAFLWKPAVAHRGGLLDGRDVGATRRIGINPFDNAGGEVFINVSGFTSVSYSAYIGQWAILAFTKPAGAGQTVRAHVYRYATSTWTHTDLGAISANLGTTLTTIFVGSFDPGQFLNGNLAAIGLWTGTALADAAFEAGSGFQTALSNWFNQTPSVLWRFNQASTATPVTDLMASGADQTAITGTTVSADDPPGFSYSITSTVTGTALADLGALSGTAAGGALRTGAALADLGALTATAVAAPPEPPDRFVSVIMDELLSCLCTISASQPNPPAHCCFRVGTEIAHDAGILQDQCCEGIGYVALQDSKPSSESFPEADIVRQAQAHCAPAAWAQTFKVGLIRCSPIGDQFTPPSCAEWNAAARQNIIDAFTLRQVACCIRNFVVNNEERFLGMSLVIGAQTQGNPQGGCVERSMEITVQFPNDCDGCR